MGATLMKPEEYDKTEVEKLFNDALGRRGQEREGRTCIEDVMEMAHGEDGLLRLDQDKLLAQARNGTYRELPRPLHRFRPNQALRNNV